MEISDSEKTKKLVHVTSKTTINGGKKRRSDSMTGRSVITDVKINVGDTWPDADTGSEDSQGHTPEGRLPGAGDARNKLRTDRHGGRPSRQEHSSFQRGLRLHSRTEKIEISCRDYNAGRNKGACNSDKVITCPSKTESVMKKDIP